jgi:peptide/nickel transport system substrate-binding protein
LDTLGLRLFTPATHRATTINVVAVPDGVDEAKVRARLLDMGVEMGGGLGALAGKVWRVGVMGYNAQPERVARFLQASLEQVGVHTELDLLPYPENRAAIQAGKHDMCIFGWVGDTGDPDNFLYVLLHSKQANTERGAQNVALYADPEVDRMLLDAQAAANEQTREALYASIQDKIASDAPWVPLAHSELVVAGRAELQNVVLSPTGHPVYSLIHRRENP